MTINFIQLTKWSVFRSGNYNEKTESKKSLNKLLKSHNLLIEAVSFYFIQHLPLEDLTALTHLIVTFL